MKQDLISILFDCDKRLSHELSMIIGMIKRAESPYPVPVCTVSVYQLGTWKNSVSECKKLKKDISKIIKKLSRSNIDEQSS